jgi:cytoskeletal protein CcmA (bactofilin family)
MNTIIMNGKAIYKNAHGTMNINIRDGRITVNGKPLAESEDINYMPIEIHGNVESLSCSGSVHVDGDVGNCSTAGSLHCRDIKGTATVSGSVQANTVGTLYT